MGNLRLAQNRYADAQKNFERALEKDPSSKDALAGRDQARRKLDASRRHH
jgi:Tfp pilus assembly protein PilF